MKGFLSEADADAPIPMIKADRERVAAELAAAEVEREIVALHPGLIATYLQQIDALAETLATFAHERDEASKRLTATFRRLVQRADPPGPSGVDV